MPDQLEKLDAWIKRQDDKPGRPEAIRRILDEALPPLKRERKRGK
jgi:hypothetical protein